MRLFIYFLFINIGSILLLNGCSRPTLDEYPSELISCWKRLSKGQPDCKPFANFNGMNSCSREIIRFETDSRWGVIDEESGDYVDNKTYSYHIAGNLLIKEMPPPTLVDTLLIQITNRRLTFYYYYRGQINDINPLYYKKTRCK